MEGFKNIESSNEQTNEKVQEQMLDLGHQEILENYEYKDMFIDFINSLNPENKEKFLNILKHIPDEILEEYLDVNFEDDSEENGEFFFDEYEENYYILDDYKTNNNQNEKIETTQKINPKIKEIINTINLLTDADKNNQLIIDSLIKQINKLKLLNLNLKESKLLEKNINILRIEKINTSNEKINTSNEKINTSNEKINTSRKEAYDLLIKNKIKIKNINKSFYELINNSEKLFIGDKDSKLSLDVQKIDFISKKIYEYLNTGNNAVEFFDKIKKSGNTELYNKIYNSLSNISPDIKELLDKKDIKPLVDEKKYISIMPNGHQEGDKYVSGDKYIDFSENPPIGYITLENGLKLKTKITAPHTMKLRAEFARKQKEYKKTTEKLKENIEKLDTKITDLKNDITEKKSRIEQIRNSDVSPEDKKRFINNIKEIIFKNQRLIEEYTKSIKFEKAAIEKENAKFKKIKEIFERNMYELIENARDELLEGDEKVRKSLQFLDSIGIDSSLLSGLESMIKVINRNSGLRNKLGFDRRINLANFDLGIDNGLGNNDNGENSIKTKEKFASIINILLSGSKKRPIETESMSTGTTFKNKAGEIVNKDSAIGDIKEDMGINIYGHMFKNAMEYDGEEE